MRIQIDVREPYLRKIDKRGAEGPRCVACTDNEGITRKNRSAQRRNFTISVSLFMREDIKIESRGERDGWRMGGRRG